MGLTFDEYQEGAARTAIYPGKGTIIGLMYVGLGLGETGEVQGKIKKVLRDANGILTDKKRAEIEKELGDILWYTAAACDEMGLFMGDVAMHNLEKLSDRKARGVLQGDGDNR